MKLRLPLAVLILACSAPALARTEVPVEATASSEADSTPAPNKASQPAPAGNERRGNAPRAAEQNRNSVPRWHSFLPGMFR
ncbi:hypothetical protein [Luteimonas sp. e5]